MPKVKVDDLYPTAPAKIHPEFYDRVKESIKAAGLLRPIVVWYTQVANWRKMHSLSKDILPPPDNLSNYDEVMLVMCGNNRLKIAKELGMTEVDCVICTTEYEVSEVCTRQRKEWKSMNYELLTPTENPKTQ